MGLGQRKINNLKLRNMIPIPVVVAILTAAGTVLTTIANNKNGNK